jgi:hypothetical protein
LRLLFLPQIDEYFTGGYKINGNKSSLIFQNPSQTAPKDLQQDIPILASNKVSGNMLLFLKEDMCIKEFYAQDSAMKDGEMIVELCQGADCVATCAGDFLPGSKNTSLPEEITQLGKFFARTKIKGSLYTD